MAIYVIKVTGYIPYPISREYTERASNFSAAISRAVKQYRKEDRVKGKKMKRMGVQAVRGFATKLI